MQIEERKNLISTINNSIVSTGQEAISYRESNNSFSKLDLPSTDGALDLSFRHDNISESYAHLTTFDGKDPFIGINGDFDKEKQPQEINQLEKVSSAADSLKELSGTAQSTIVPSLIPQKSKRYSLIEEDLAELEEEIVEDVSDVPDTAPEEEDVKPPPLAGANVMNVILVAAECAPWSKTGI